ncbi:RDD family protein [Inquilinus sp. KBS0705]|nr:RDD family protein [Inquilinus sp. KBS0705]
MKFYTIEPKPHIKLRIIATLIDYGIYFIFLFIFLYVFDEDPQEGKMQVTGSLTLVLPIVWFLYFVILESANQATPGHDIVKLKVYTLDGRKPTFSACLKRRLLDPFDIFMYGIPALVCISKTARHQRLGDLWADTIIAKNNDITEKDVIF